MARISGGADNHVELHKTNAIAAGKLESKPTVSACRIHNRRTLMSAIQENRSSPIHNADTEK